MISGHWLITVLDEMGLKGKLDNFLYVAEVEILFSKLFSRVRDSSIHVEQSTELSLNWALSCYDRLVC